MGSESAHRAPKERRSARIVIDGGAEVLGDPGALAEALGRFYARQVLAGASEFPAPSNESANDL